MSVSTDGTPRPLAPGADLTAYRIVQEALTNVTKHAAADHAEVRFDYGLDRLRIRVTNPGPTRAASPTAQGYGLDGMRERALSVGGSVRAGPRPDGGFEVSALLPLPPAAG